MCAISYAELLQRTARSYVGEGAKSGITGELKNAPGSHDVLRRHAKRFVDRDIGIGLAALDLSSRDCADLSQDVIITYQTSLARMEKFAGLVESRWQIIDKEAALGDNFIVGLALVRKA